MAIMEFNKIVKRLSKKDGDIVDHDDLFDFVDPGNARGEAGKRDVYKLTYALKSAGVLFPIRNGLFLVQKPVTENVSQKNRAIKPLSESEIIEKHYWKIVRKLILRNAPRDGIIVGSKSLEFHLKDESIPDTLIVYTLNTNKILSVSSGYRIQFRTVVSGKKEGRENIISFLLKMSERMEIDGNLLRVAGKELALLDAFLIHKGMPEVDEYLIRKFLKRHARAIDRDILGKLVAKKYVTAANRLRAIAKELGETELYEKALDTIKREGGGCFVSF